MDCAILIMTRIHYCNLNLELKVKITLFLYIALD